MRACEQKDVAQIKVPGAAWGTLSFLAISSNLVFSPSVMAFHFWPRSLPTSPKPASGCSFFTYMGTSHPT